MKSVHIISIMGNQGTFTKRLGQILASAEILYHLMYIMFCILGLCMHPFFYSVLVSYQHYNVYFIILNHYDNNILIIVDFNRNNLNSITYNIIIHCIFVFQLLDVVYREETLLNVIRSVTRNGRSIILTAVLALILVYLFSIIGYMFFKDDFLVQVDDDVVFGECANCYLFLCTGLF